jgi:hypothetical protein
MSTRGAFGFKVDGLYRIAYNHSDSYPGGLGNDIAEEWLRRREKHGEDLKRIAARVRLVPEKSLLGDEGAARALEYLAAYQKSGTYPPYQRRELESTIAVLTPKHPVQVAYSVCDNPLSFALDVGLMVDSFEFLGNTLFCEWAYVIDLDADRMEVYRGNVEEAHEDGPFARLFGTHKTRTCEYYPARQIARLTPAAAADDWITHIEITARGDELDDVTAHDRMLSGEFIAQNMPEKWNEDRPAKSAPLVHVRLNS